MLKHFFKLAVVLLAFLILVGCAGDESAVNGEEDLPPIGEEPCDEATETDPITDEDDAGNGVDNGTGQPIDLTVYCHYCSQDVAAIDLINIKEMFNLDGKKKEPFCRDHFALEHQGTRVTGYDELIAALGKPVSERMEEDIGIDLRVIEYDDIIISMRPEDETIIRCSIESNAIAGPRGVKVGDSVGKVLSSFYYEDEVAVIRHDQCYYARLYHVEQESRIGFLVFNQQTDEIEAIRYAMHFGPHCGVTFLEFRITGGVVSSINYNSF